MIGTNTKQLLTKEQLPGICIIIPTLNSIKTLKACLKSISAQDYPAESIDVVVADGGSTDGTVELVKDLELPFNCKIVGNPLRTGEAGKAVGLRMANNEILAFVDSDNILPHSDWLKRMIEPFQDPEVVASEPIEYTYRKEDGYITRYSALLGMNDPLCLFLGNYDRYNTLTDSWTGILLKEEDRGSYIKVTLDSEKIPTTGANGFLIRKFCVDDADIGDYFFDIDIISEMSRKHVVKIAKVKTGIVHLFSGGVRTFTRKQRRRIRDFTYYNQLGIRKYPWNALDKKGLAKFICYNILFFPLIGQSLKGYLKRPDFAWFFHPVACEITLWEYGWGKILSFFGAKELNRDKWQQ